MKKYIFLPMLMVCISGMSLNAQQRETRKHTIDLNVSLFGFDSFNSMTPSIGIEYLKQFNGNFRWGILAENYYGMGSMTKYDWSGNGPSPYRNSVNQNVTRAFGMIHYDLNVIKNVLFLRSGVGAGAAFHYVTEEQHVPEAKWKIFPSFTAEINWVVKFRNGIELKFAPLIISPSRFTVSPGKLGPPTDVTPWDFNVITCSFGKSF